MLNYAQIEQNKAAFIELLRDNVARQGINELIAWLETTDFFTAPASSKPEFHHCYKGGLCRHSLEVYHYLMDEIEHGEIGVDKETATIVALLHDVVKTNTYTDSFRNVKDQFGHWQQVPCYTFTDNYGIEHGDCSVILIQQFMKLTWEEAAAISAHMGGFSNSVKGGSYATGTVYNKYPVAVYLHIADLKSTYFSKK